MEPRFTLETQLDTALWAAFRTVRLDISNLYYPRSTQAGRICLNAWDSVKLSLLEGQ
jgi:hypothetical protein